MTTPRSLTGLGTLLRLALRRDRIRLPIWIVTIVGLVALVAVTLGDLYPTAVARRQLSTTVGANPALRALLGPVYGRARLGGLVSWRMSFASLVLVPLMAIFAVVRHTRAEEEAGRLELLGSTVMGRRAPLLAALLVSWGAALLLGAGVILTMLAVGSRLEGSLAMGAAFALSGMVFASVAAVCAQLTANARTASGAAILVLGVAFLVRSVGDAVDPRSWVTMASPLGWIVRMRVFGHVRWWLAGLALGVAVALAVVADLLTTRRDLEAGLLPPRPGAAEAAAWLRGPLGLAWRLHRVAVLWWIVGLFALGLMYGGVAESVGQLVRDTPQLQQAFQAIGGQQALIDAFFATTMTIAGYLTAGFMVHTVLRLRAEETSLRADDVLATAVRRTPWALSHVGVAVGGGVLMLAAMGAGAGLAHGLRAGDVGHQLGRLVPAALGQLPAVLVVAAFGLALVGLAPRFVGLVWGALVAFLVLGELGPFLRLDQWLLDTSPFLHLARLPGGEVTLLPLAALTAVAVGLGAAGLVGLRRRDIGRV